MHDEPGDPGHSTPTAEGTEATVTQAAYAADQVIEYTSFDPSGYSTGQVVGYAPADEQTRVCPNCNQLSVPGEPDENGLRACPRCQAVCRFPALDPRVYIRARAGGKPFPARESQLRPHQAAPRPETTSPVPLAAAGSITGGHDAAGPAVSRAQNLLNGPGPFTRSEATTELGDAAGARDTRGPGNAENNGPAAADPIAELAARRLSDPGCDLDGLLAGQPDDLDPDLTGHQVWNVHANGLGEYCPWSGRLVSPNREALMSGLADDDEGCPQGCRGSAWADPEPGTPPYQAAIAAALTRRIAEGTRRPAPSPARTSDRTHLLTRPQTGAPGSPRLEAGRHQARAGDQEGTAPEAGP